MAEEGLFSLVVQEEDELTRDLPDLDALADGLNVDEPILYKLTLPMAQSGHLLYLLSQLGLGAGRIYPGRRSAELEMYEKTLYVQ